MIQMPPPMSRRKFVVKSHTFIEAISQANAPKMAKYLIEEHGYQLWADGSGMFILALPEDSK